MFKKPITLEHALYGLALAIAIGLRFYHLGRLPLSDYEADFALQSMNLANGIRTAIGPNPGYVHLTTILFYIFNASHFLARFVPALAGSALIISPWFLRQRIGRNAALVLAFGLALDPGLNALSRLAGGPILAITCLAFVLVLWLDGRRVATGFFAGLAILCGPAVWLGILGILLTWAIAKVIPSKILGEDADGKTNLVRVDLQSKEFRNMLSWGIGTFLVVGSLFVLSPLGIAAAANSFLVFLSGWITLSDVPLGRVLLAIPAYELLPLVFGLTALIRGWIKRDRLSIIASLWLVATFLLILIRVNHEVMNLGWFILPLWVLAAIELGRHFDFSSGNGWVIGGAITFIFVLLILAWFTLAEISLFDPLTVDANLQWLFIGGILLVICISLVLVGSGWSINEARLGGVWGVLIPLILFSVAMTTGAIGVREPRTLELWNPEPRLGRADLVLKVANDLSLLNNGFDAGLPLTIVGVDSSALRFLFRDWEVEVTEVLGPDDSPALVITSMTTDLALAADYRGEALVWREVGDWYNASFHDWVNWYIYRQMPVQREDIILWARTDLMLESQDSSTP